MTTKTRVTKAQAEAVLTAVKEQFAPWVEADPYNAPVLIMDWDWTGYGPTPSIIWEGGPFEWAHLFPHGGPDEEFGGTIGAVKMPKGVWTECATSWALHVYPEGR